MFKKSRLTKNPIFRNYDSLNLYRFNAKTSGQIRKNMIESLTRSSSRKIRSTRFSGSISIEGFDEWHILKIAWPGFEILLEIPKLYSQFNFFQILKPIAWQFEAFLFSLRIRLCWYHRAGMPLKARNFTW